MKEGDTLVMKHRIYIHQGDASSGSVRERYEEYAGMKPKGFTAELSII
ncbi:hypothetical protein [Cohnella laeviribosi]